jgi:heme exporter protein B
MSLLLSFESIFKSDYVDGNLEQIKLSSTSLLSYVGGKCLAQWAIIVLPLLLALPIVSLMLDLSIQHYAGLFFSVLVASPALIAYGAFSGACLVGYKSSGVLLILLTVPVLIPILIFGIAAVTGYEQAGLAAFEFQILAGLTLIACAIALPAGAAALNSVLE